MKGVDVNIDWKNKYNHLKKEYDKLNQHNKKIKELLNEAIEGWDNNFSLARSEYEIFDSDVWDKEQTRINKVKQYLIVLN